MTCLQGCCESQAAHYRSVAFNKVAPAVNLKDSKLSRDLDAYKRLRHAGLQPRTTDYSSDLERHAETQFEVETGHLFRDKEQRRQAMEVVERGKEAQMELAESGRIVINPRPGVTNEWRDE